MSDLMSLLRDDPHAFDLFQAISILERSEPARAPVGTSVGMDEALRLKAQVEMSFAPSDISDLDDSKQPGPPLTLKSPVLTLAGSQGPLPTPFTELLMDRRRARDNSGLDFLDIFNQRLLGFLYRSRRKHHMALSTGSINEAPIVRSLDALASLGRAEGVRGPDGEQAWLRHAGLQGAAPRSMVSLLAVVRDRMGVHFRASSSSAAGIRWRRATAPHCTIPANRPPYSPASAWVQAWARAPGTRAPAWRSMRRRCSRRSMRRCCPVPRTIRCWGGWWDAICNATSRYGCGSTWRFAPRRA